MLSASTNGDVLANEAIKIKKLVVITEKANIRRLVKEIDENTTVIGWNQEVCQELERINIKHKKIKTKFNEEIGLRWIKALAKKRINLISLLEYERTSLWWWMEYWLYASRGYYDSFFEVIKSVYIMQSIIKEERPDKIIYVNEGLLVDKAIRLLAKKTKSIESYYKILQFRIAKKVKIQLYRIYLKLQSILRKIILNLMLTFRRENTQNKNNILFVYRLHPMTKKSLDPILEKLRDKNYNMYILDIYDPMKFLPIKQFKEKLNNPKLKNIVLENYVSGKDKREIKRLTKKYQRLYNDLKKKKEFKALFEFNGVNIWKLVEPQLSCYFNVRLKNHLLDNRAVDNIINSVKPSTAVTPTETTEFEKGMFLSCQKKGIPTIAIQHGLLNDLRCTHDKGEISLKEIKPKYCPIPTKTAVFGANDKNFLATKGNYPKESIVITGNQRYDFIKNTSFDKKQICKTLRLNPEKKIVVLATGPFDLIKDREIQIEAVSKAVKQLNNVQLIVKVHPYEKKSFYEKRIKDKKNVIIRREYDIFKILFICDAVLTIGSTVGLEATMLNKPIISTNYIGIPHSDDYVKEGVALRVDDPKELSNTIKKALYDKKIIGELAKKRKKYVYNHCYKVDRKASDRIAELIIKCAD